MALGIALLYGPRRMWFLMSEVPLYVLRAQTSRPSSGCPWLELQGYLAHKKLPLSRTLQ